MFIEQDVLIHTSTAFVQIQYNASIIITIIIIIIVIVLLLLLLLRYFIVSVKFSLFFLCSLFLSNFSFPRGVYNFIFSLYAREKFSHFFLSFFACIAICLLTTCGAFNFVYFYDGWKPAKEIASFVLYLDTIHSSMC